MFVQFLLVYTILNKSVMFSAHKEERHKPKHY